MNERERHTLAAMQHRLEECDAGRIGLARLVEELELLLSLVEDVPVSWRDQFRQQWAILEETYAVALDRNLPIDSEENRREIAPALARMRRLLFELLPIQVPYSFIRQRVRLTWADVLFGLEAGTLPPASVAEAAVDRMIDGATEDGVADLASADPDVPVYSIVRQLARGESAHDADVSRRKWAFLMMAWMVMHPEIGADDGEVLRKVYEDLGRPRQLDPFVQSLATGSQESLRQRLADYVRAETSYFAPSNSRSTVGSLSEGRIS